MGAKTKAATDAVKNLYQARQHAMGELATILSEMPPIEVQYKAKAKAADDAYDAAVHKLGGDIIKANFDPTFSKLQLEQIKAGQELDEKWEEVKKWVNDNAGAYSGMDAALKKLKEKIDKKKVLDFFKTQKSLPEAKTIYDDGVKANTLFQQTLELAAADYKAYKFG